MNIPIYRAKRIDSGEYVKGYFVHNLIGSEGNLLFNANGKGVKEIDPTTLAIHFPDMLDSQGNKVFASLSEDGKGGDIVYYDDNRDFTALYKDCKMYLDHLEISLMKSICNLKTKGIKE